MASYCAKCQRRMVITYHVPEDVKRTAACFDELAEKAQIRYSFEQTDGMSWSDRVPRRRR